MFSEKSAERAGKTRRGTAPGKEQGGKAATKTPSEGDSGGEGSSGKKIKRKRRRRKRTER